jgi:hypothetical protein
MLFDANFWSLPCDFVHCSIHHNQSGGGCQWGSDKLDPFAFTQAVCSRKLAA